VAPVGTSQHGDSHLLCVPTQAFDILVFFGANYVAHAATVRAYPGESAFNLGWGVVAAMLLPTSGMFRGSSAILRARFGSSRSPSPLELAARCGALCMVVRTKDWKPVAGDRLTQVAVTKRDSRRATAPPLAHVADVGPTENCGLGSRRGAARVPRKTALLPHADVRRLDASRIDRPKCVSQINGHQMLPDGYAFAFVPSNAKVVPLDDGDRPTVPPPQISVTKGLIALGQAGYAFFTLYTARGDQITRYGYSAPGLSVLPYAFMSTVNLVAALLSPDYAGLYLVQSDTLLEASARPGANFEGVVGKL
ncbi:hypothetical protein DFH06DRAFT_960668, partial [Mycena polygramma]